MKVSVESVWLFQASYQIRLVEHCSDLILMFVVFLSLTSFLGQSLSLLADVLSPSFC